MRVRVCVDCREPSARSVCPRCAELRRLITRVLKPVKVPTEATRRAAIHRGRVAGLRGVL